MRISFLFGALTISACVCAYPTKPPDISGELNRAGLPVSLDQNQVSSLGTSHQTGSNGETTSSSSLSHVPALPSHDGMVPLPAAQSHLLGAAVSTSESRVSSEERMLAHLHLTRNDPLWEPIVRFHLAHRRLLSNDALPSNLVSEFVPIYSSYQRRYRVRRNYVDFHNPNFVRELIADDTSRNRIRSMNLFVESMLRHASALHLDNIKVNYLRALSMRFSEVDRMMTPIHSEIGEMWERQFQEHYMDTGRLSSEDPEQAAHAVRTGKLMNRSHRILQDFNFVTMLETEFDRVLRRLQAGGHVKLVRRHGSESEGASDVSGESVRSTEDRKLESLGMTRSDAHWQPILDFYKENQPLLPSKDLPPDLAQDFIKNYRMYQIEFPKRGHFMDPQNPLQLYSKIYWQQGRDRIRRMNQFVKGFLAHAEELHLSPIRLEYLKSLESRLDETDKMMTPSREEIWQRWVREVKDLHLQLKGKPMPFHGKPWAEEMDARNDKLQAKRPRIVGDFNFVSNLERELDELAGHLEPRVRLWRSSEIGEVGPSQLRRRALDNEAPRSSSPRPSAASSEISLASVRDNLPEPMGTRLSYLGLSADDPEAAPIIAFNSRHDLLLEGRADASRFVSRFARAYSRYQNMFRRTGLAAAISQVDVFLTFVKEPASRDRLRHMKRFISGMLEHAQELNLDAVRVGYLQALIARLEGADEILSPTIPEILADYDLKRARRYRRLLPGVANLVDLELQRDRAIAERTEKIMANLMRLSSDFFFLFRTEIELNGLFSRTRSEARRLVRRSEAEGQDRSDLGEKEEDSQIRLLRSEFHLLHKRGSASSSLSRSSSSSPNHASSSTPSEDASDTYWSLRTKPEALQYLSVTENDPQAEPIVRFHMQYDRVLPLNAVPQEVASELGQLYSIYQRRYSSEPLPRDWNPLSYRILWDPHIRDRVAEMREILRVMLQNAQALQLDHTRLEYVQAVQARLDQALRILSPTRRELNDQTKVLGSIMKKHTQTNDFEGLIKWYERLYHQRYARYTENRRRLNVDFDLISKFETELEELVDRTKAADAHLVRRSGHVQENESPDNKESASRRLDLWPRRVTDSHPSSQPGISVDEALSHMHMARDEPGAIAIADYMRRQQPLIPPYGIEPQRRRRLADVWRPYQAKHRTRGELVELHDPNVVFHEMAYSSGRDRFRDMHAVVDHLLQEKDALGLTGVRQSFLEAIRERFIRAEAAMTPTVDELIGLGTPNERSQRMLNWVNSRFDDIPFDVRPALQGRVQPLFESPEPYIQDLVFIQRVEAELDKAVERLEHGTEEGRSALRAPIRRRSLVGVLNMNSRSVRDANLLATEMHVFRRRDIPTNEGPSKERPPPRRETIQEVLTSLRMRQDDPGAVAIANYWRLHEDLLRPIYREQQQMQRLVEQYRSYQQAIPNRGSAINFQDFAQLRRHWLDDMGRDRFLHIDPIITFMLEHREQLRLDDVRVGYLEALRDRFRWTREQMTPTVEELVRQTTSQVRSVPTEGLPAYISQATQRLMARFELAETHLMRFTHDLGFVNHLEKELEYVVRLAARGATRANTHLAPRSMQETGEDAKKIHRRSPPQQDASAEGIPSVSETLERIHMTSDEPGALPIARFWRLNEHVLKPIHGNLEQMQQMAELFRSYQQAIPYRGRSLQWHAEELMKSHMLGNIGRDRFALMEPILRYLLEHRASLHLDETRVSFLLALRQRFERTRQLMTPTIDELQAEMRDIVSGLAPGLPPIVRQNIVATQSARIVSRSTRAREHNQRFWNDLGFVNALEDELEEISKLVQPVAGSSGHLHRRDVPVKDGKDTSANDLSSRLEQFASANGPGTRPKPLSETVGGLAKRRLSPVSVMDSDEPTAAEMRDILQPLGMGLGDAYAQPIALWRLSENSLLDQRRMPNDLRSALRGRWLMHRQHYEQMRGDTDILPPQARLWRYFDTDEGGRFSSANQIIQFLLDNRERLWLSVNEADYLNALRSRFELTHRLMRPLPSTLAALARAGLPTATPRAQERALRSMLNQRSVRLRAQAHRVNIDTMLLQGFESELDYLHGMLLAHV